MTAAPAEADAARRRLYRETFGSDAGRAVLADLARACFADAPTYVRGDALESARREGARGVWLRIGRLAAAGEDEAR